MSDPPRTTVVIPRPELPPWFNWKLGAGIGGFLFLVLLAVNSIFTVPVDSVGVVLRFGAYNAPPRGAGLHFKIPFIDQKAIVPVERQQKMEFGFESQRNMRTNPNQASSRSEQAMESSMITGDRNAASVKWVVQYRIQDPVAYLFDVRDPESTLRDGAESVMRGIVGDRLVDEVLTVGRGDIEAQCVQKLRELSTEYSLGLEINQVQLTDVNPPAPVRSSFNEVNEAQQEQESTVNTARAKYNSAVPRAEGEADREIDAARGTAIRRTNEAEGDAQRFNAVYAEYEKAPGVTRQRLYLETMAEVLPSFQRRILMDGDQSGVLPLLQLDQPTTTPRQ